jgi:hypothetical protein
VAELELIPIDEDVSRIGTPFEVYPRQPPPVAPVEDPRTIALKAFAAFLATMEFRYRGIADTTQTIAFKIPPKNIHIEQPDNVVDGAFPSIVFLPGRGAYDYFGLGPAKIIDGSENQFAPGTALIIPGEYVETVTLEVWASKRVERRSIIAGIEADMLREQQSTATRLLLKVYFNQVASFSLDNREIIDDNDSARGRRRAHLYIEMRVPIAQLVPVKELSTYILDPDY